MINKEMQPIIASLHLFRSRGRRFMGHASCLAINGKPQIYVMWLCYGPPNTRPVRVYWAVSFFSYAEQYKCSTQTPHDQLLQKSWQAVMPVFRLKNPKYMMFSFVRQPQKYVRPNTLPVGEVVYILLFYVRDNAIASHRSPMTIYIKSQSSGI